MVTEGSRAISQAGDDWPHTKRPLPWLVAALLMMIWLVPFDVLKFPIPLPFNATFDRGLLLLCLAVWAYDRLIAKRHNERQFRHSATDVWLVIFVLICLASIVLDYSILHRLDQLSLSNKKLILVIFDVALYLFVANNVRASETTAFVTFGLALAMITSLGVIIEYRTGLNIFYRVASMIPGADVPAHSTLTTSNGRPDITGPARHGLAVATMFAMVFPFAIVRVISSDTGRRRLIYLAAAVVLLIADFSTLRRSGIVLPVISIATIVILGGRRYLPVAPILVLVLAIAPIVVPGAIGQLEGQLAGESAAAQSSTEHRISSYAEVIPDIRNRTIIGRGFGSYDPTKYRILDNEYLGLLVETGALGMVAYIALIISALLMCRRTFRGFRDGRDEIALACGAAAAAYLVSGALFDVLAFPQAPYLFLIFVAIAGVRRSSALSEFAPAPILATA
jgi:O-antigen ligase